MYPKKWVKVHDQSSNIDGRCKPSKQIRFKTPMLQSDLCNYSDAYIVVKGKITVTGANNRDRKQRFHLNLTLSQYFFRLIALTDTFSCSSSLGKWIEVTVMQCYYINVTSASYVQRKQQFILGKISCLITKLYRMGMIQDKVLKNGPSEICGRQSLKKLR